jgi:hypothetical protein
MKMQVNLLKMPPSRESRKAPGWKKMFVLRDTVLAGSLLLLRKGEIRSSNAVFCLFFRR